MKLFNMLFILIALSPVPVRIAGADDSVNEQKKPRYRVEITQFRLDVPYTLLVDDKEVSIDTPVSVPPGKAARLIVGDTNIVTVSDAEKQNTSEALVMARVNGWSQTNHESLHFWPYLPEGVDLVKRTGLVWVHTEEASILYDPRYDSSETVRNCFFEAVPESDPPLFKYVEQELYLGTQYHFWVQDLGAGREKMSVRIEYTVAAGRTPIEGVQLDAGPLTVEKYEDTFENLAVQSGSTLFIEKNISEGHALISVLHYVSGDKVFPKENTNGKIIETTVFHLPGFSEASLKSLGAEQADVVRMDEGQVFQLPGSANGSDASKSLFAAVPEAISLSSPRVTLGSEPSEMADAMNYLTERIRPSEPFIKLLNEYTEAPGAASAKIVADVTGDNALESDWSGTILFAARPLSAPSPTVRLVIEHRSNMKDLAKNQYVFAVSLPAEQEGVFLLWPDQVEKRELAILVSISSAQE